MGEGVDLRRVDAVGGGEIKGIECLHLREARLAQALADDRFRSKEQREQFVEHLRAHLAQRIEFGQPLEPVHLRAGEERAVSPRSQDRDYRPTR